MCGRFTQHYTWSEVHAFLSVFGPPRNLQPRYNVAPTTTVDVIRLGAHGQRELVARSGERRLDSLMHRHRLGRERVDGTVSRPYAGAAGGEGFRGMA